MAAMWPLTPARAGALVGESGTDTVAWAGAVEAAVAWVEDRRGDLLDPDTGAFAATTAVELGTAMLARRWYARRNSPLGVIGAAEDTPTGMLREDPDIAKLLGIGRSRRLTFGGSR